MTRPVIVTMGEPAGVGAELVVKAWRALRARGPAFACLDDPDRLAAEGARQGVPIVVIDQLGAAAGAFAAALPVMPLRLARAPRAGVLDAANARAVVESIEHAVVLAQAGEAAAICTSPIHKAALYATGFAHPGHTEFLAALAGTRDVAMMLVGGGLRVVPLTIHVPLRDAPALVTRDLIETRARLVARELRGRFGVATPRLALAGLNPHAGESGTIGREEIDVFAPAVASVRAEGIDIAGPLSADAMFHPRARAAYDAALCPTHDQALIPLKTLAFDEGVNVTLGLPFVRTSPDHGPALDIAGRGLAEPGSMIAAIRLAAELGARESAS